MSAPWNILAVWPEHETLRVYHDLDSRQLYDTGLAYTALRGADASRAGLARELQEGDYNVLEVLTHGENGQVHLQDGLTEPGWWGRLARNHPLVLVVFLSCETASPRQNNATRALLRAGVDYVVAADRQLLALDAVNFATLFYSSLADGLSVEDAFAQSELVMPRASAEMVRLHTSKKKSRRREWPPTDPIP
jgi:hypothetical protein